MNSRPVLLFSSVGTDENNHGHAFREPTVETGLTVRNYETLESFNGEEECVAFCK